jgi:hypothetical protein
MKEGKKCGGRTEKGKDDKCTHGPGRQFEGKRALERQWR